MEEKRHNPFTEKLSLFMVTVAALGAFLVLFDPKFTLQLGTQEISVGGEGFSADLKGAVISAILIGGWTAVKEYWLGSSAGTVKSAETLQRIAEGPTAPVVTPADQVVPAAVAEVVKAGKGKK